MYCERCGSQLGQGQRFCPSCGKPVGIAIVPIERQSKVQQHLHVLAILWLLAGALNLFAGAALFLVASIIFGGAIHLEGLANFQPVMRTILSVIGGIVFLKAILALGAGWGLLQRESWARPLAIVLSFIELIHIPFGTALGVYTLIVLLPNESGAEYERLAEAA
jgi:hypothetical protein